MRRLRGLYARLQRRAITLGAKTRKLSIGGGAIVRMSRPLVSQVFGKAKDYRMTLGKHETHGGLWLDGWPAPTCPRPPCFPLADLPTLLQATNWRWVCVCACTKNISRQRTIYEKTRAASPRFTSTVTRARYVTLAAAH